MTRIEENKTLTTNLREFKKIYNTGRSNAITAKFMMFINIQAIPIFGCAGGLLNQTRIV